MGAVKLPMMRVRPAPDSAAIAMKSAMMPGAIRRGDSVNDGTNSAAATTRPPSSHAARAKPSVGKSSHAVVSDPATAPSVFTA